MNKKAHASNGLVDTILNVLANARQRHEDELYNEGYNEGRATQRERDVEAAIMAFLKLKVKDQDIYKLLSSYFGIDSIAEVSDRLFSAKKTRQIRLLKDYCHKQGMSLRDFRSYSIEHNLEERLVDDERLLEMSPEKLKSILDKD